MKLADDKIMAAVEQAIQDHYLPPLDSESLDDDGGFGDGRYILLERSHYGRTWASSHASPEGASYYTLNQEYAEDWAATVLIDRETGKQLIPDSIIWREV